MASCLMEVVESNAEFSKRLYKELATSKKGNLVCSPLSNLIALAMIYAGAEGETAEEMASTLCLPNKQQALMGISKLRTLLPSKSMCCGELKLSVANKVCLKSGVPVHCEYKSAMEKYFDSAAEQVDLNDPEFVEAINNWISKSTCGKIKEVLSKQMNPFGNPLTFAVLFNAVYFQCNWKDPFHLEATETKTFYTDEMEKIKVPFMISKGRKWLYYADLEELDAQLLCLPYKSQKFSMALFLPNKMDGLPNLEDKLANADLDDLLEKMDSTSTVNVFLPKFKIESSPIDIKSLLEKMGMSRVFDPKVSNLSGITSVEPAWLNNIQHKAFIEVNEKGTEAAAFSYFPLYGGGKEPPKTKEVTFKADHPFYYTLLLQTNIGEQPLEEKEFAVPIFCGRVCNPTL